MFNKDGIPFFTIMIPFLSILFVTFFATSYYLKLSSENFEVDLKEFKTMYILKSNNKKELDLLIKEKIKQQELREQKFKDFMITLTGAILVFMALFSLLMISIITDVVKKYKTQVQNKEAKLQSLNKTLSTKVEEGIKEIFGTTTATEGKVKLKAPDIAENGAVIPVTVSSKLAGSKVAIFQDANPESTVAVFTVPKGGIIDYSVRIKMAKTGVVTAIVEDAGKLYKASKTVKVTIGGCGG